MGGIGVEASLEDLVDQVDSEESFLTFIAALVVDRVRAVQAEKEHPSSPYGPDAGGWENTSIESFLESASAWAEATNFGLTQGLRLDGLENFVAPCVVIPCVARNEKNCKDRFAFARELTPDVGVRIEEAGQIFRAGRFIDSCSPICRDVAADGAMRREVSRRYDRDDDAVLVTTIAYFARRRCSDYRDGSDDLCDPAKGRTHIVPARRIHEDKRQRLQLYTRQSRLCRLDRCRECILASGATATNLDLRAQT